LAVHEIAARFKLVRAAVRRHGAAVLVARRGIVIAARDESVPARDGLRLPGGATRGAWRAAGAREVLVSDLVGCRQAASVLMIGALKRRQDIRSEKAYRPDAVIVASL